MQTKLRESINRMSINESASKFIGLVFIASSILKAVNTYAFGQTIRGFLPLLGISHLQEYTELLAVFVCACELLLGLLMFHSRYRYLATICITPMLIMFTYITYINFTDLYGGIESCGCFGEVIHLSAAETFYKNIILSVITVALLAYQSYKQERLLCIVIPMLKDKFLYIALGTSIIASTFSPLSMKLLESTTYVALYMIVCVACLVCCSYVLFTHGSNTNTSLTKKQR